MQASVKKPERAICVLDVQFKELCIRNDGPQRAAYKAEKPHLAVGQLSRRPAEMSRADASEKRGVYVRALSNSLAFGNVSCAELTVTQRKCRLKYSEFVT
ncbi:hypothetical protein MTO96_011785 [Rhipicephalus appendiculatus]